MTDVHSFPPLAAPDATRLILGSMPGVASLTAGRYYAHPRNAFWPLIEGLLQLPAGLDYEQRCAALRQHRIAVWDVLQSCHRPGSLDSAIDRDSMVANDFAGFLREHPQIRRVYFNGQKAALEWKRLVAPTLAGGQGLVTSVLPSSSPAHAGLPLAEKLKRWHKLLEDFN
ncbi:MAG: DNA-deoxyinosine glycosylase [Pseudomonadota bacterium]